MGNNRNRCGGPRRRGFGFGAFLVIAGIVLVCIALDWSLIALLGCLMCIGGTALAIML